MAPTIGKLLDYARQAEAAGTGYDQGQRWDWLDRIARQVVRGAEGDCSALTLGLYWLAGYPVDVPGLVSVAGVGAVEANRQDQGEGVSASTAGSWFGLPIYAARWRLRYLLTGVPQDVQPPPNPLA